MIKPGTIQTGINKANAAAANFTGVKIIGCIDKSGNFNRQTNNNNVVIISINYEGKMNGMTGVTTSPYINPCCIARLIYGVGVCKECFSAIGGSIRFNSFIDHAVYNSLIFSTAIIDPELLPRFIVPVVRLESHGDLINKVHVINYFNICNVNPGTHFTLWTKNPGFIAAAIKNGYKKPENLTVVYSSQELNTVNKDILNKYDFIDKVFTVFTADYAIKNNVHINCGNKRCIMCRACYGTAAKNDNNVFINEILKNDIDKFISNGGVVNYR